VSLPAENRPDCSIEVSASMSHSVGVFDSGVGGLSVLRAIRQSHPQQPLIYLADQAHVPYGPRSLQEVQKFATGISRFLLAQGAGLIVVACNTASAAALHHLRRIFKEVSFVGMEPAVKPAAENTHSGVVGVLATPATFQGALYASVVDRFANGVVVLQDPCLGLVSEIEAGRLQGAQTRRILEKAIKPMLEKKVDTLVLGCTHYPFVIPLIQEIAGPEVRVIDPAPAVARQTGRLLDAQGLLLPPGDERGEIRFFTTGDPDRMRAMLPLLFGESGTVLPLDWVEGDLKARSSP
jgi:glutamate racemase